MPRNLSTEGKGLDRDIEPAAIPVECDQPEDASPSAKKSTSRPSLSTPTQRRGMRAMNDAQSSLESLLKSPTGGATHGPLIISPSGRRRDETKGRVAGPAASPSASGDRPLSKTPRPHYTLGSGPDDPDDDALSLAIVPGTVPIYGLDGETDDVPDTAISRGLALASGKLQTARDQASLLVRAGDTLGLAPDAEDFHTSSRAASQWATRYATHIVVLLVVAALVAFGGLKAFTTQGAYSRDMQSSESLSTGVIGPEAGGLLLDGKPSVDSPDANIAMPRTELRGADASAGSAATPPANAGGQPQTQPQAQQQTQQQPGPQAPGSIAAGPVVKYTVAQGDTIESIAKKFDLMPETVMGSNGIYDSEEILAAGRLLMIPPIDGMYYVPTSSDTLQTVAERFQVEPDAIAAYAGNKLQNGHIIPGQPLVVPSGMIPPRTDTVTYTVREGDTLKSIAARYAIDVPTILNSNNVPRPDSLTIGTQLRLLPVPGVEYKIQKGDTVLAVAAKLNVPPQMILDYPPNNLTADTPLQVGQVIMVPGGSPEQVVVARVEPTAPSVPNAPARVEARPAPTSKPQPASSDKSSSSTGKGNSRSSNSDTQPADTPVRSDVAEQTPPTPAPRPTPRPTAVPKPQPKPNTATNTASANTFKSGTGSLIWPVNGIITQYFNRAHNGLDIAINAGTPIRAADAGKVVWAGWRTDGLGYCVMIDHLDGYSTVYGHMIGQPIVSVGQYVSKGQVIGYIGSTGRSTGPHVHFMVKAGNAASRNTLNPLAFLGAR